MNIQKEDPNVSKIRSFVTKTLESIGALVDFTEYNYAEVIIPDDFAVYFDDRGYFSLAFDFDIAKRHENSEFVTYGSYFLDRVTELAIQRGLSCKRHIIDENVELRTLPQKISNKIMFRNCRVTFMANAHAIYHYILFNFRVAYISDEREDRIFKILVNLNTGHTDDKMLEAVETAIYTDSAHTSYSVEKLLPIDLAYKSATTDLEEKIQPEIREINNKINSRLDHERGRINEYYDQIDGDLYKKREKLKSELTKPIDDKLLVSQIERQRRLNEIDEKNSLRVSIVLFNATMITQTKIRNKYSVRKGKAEREVYLVWNPAINDVDPIICDICNKEITEAELCSNSHIGCTKCIPDCSKCGALVCRGCGTAYECSVCGDILCDSCKIICEDCGDIVCEKHRENCTCKEQKRRKELEAEEKIREEERRIREEHISEFQKLPLSLSKASKQYMDDYVRANIDVLDDNWKNTLAKIQIAHEADDNIKSRSLLWELDEKYPPNGWVKAQLAMTYERWNEKMDLLGIHATRLAPNLALTHIARGHVYHKKGVNYREAMNEYEKAIELASDDESKISAYSHYQIGKLIYDTTGNHKEAREWYNKAFKIDPGLLVQKGSRKKASVNRSR